MKTYDEFLTWAAEQHYNAWINDLDGNQVAWGQFAPKVVSTAAAIYEQTPYDVNRSVKLRLAYLYGDPLKGENGSMQVCGLVDLW